MTINGIELKHGIMLAPMAGITDRSFRHICQEFGAEYMATEMVSAKAVHFGDEKSVKLAQISESEHPIAIQIFGSEPEIMAESAAKLAAMFEPDAIDINMGCPVQKIVGNGEGSALMKNPALVREIVKAVVKAINIPVTVKIRSGWDSSLINAVEIATICEEEGAAAVCVHGRTRKQLYSPPVDLNIIKQVKGALSIPVIGNGGINTAEDALRMFDYTGCDAVMIARGANGNPWIFSEIIARVEGNVYYPPSTSERINTALRQVKMMTEDKGHSGILEARKHLSWYIKGMEGAAAVRGRLNKAVSYDEIKQIIKTLPL